MASDIWQRTIQIAREETRCRHDMGYSFRLAAWNILYIYHPTDKKTHTTNFVYKQSWSTGSKEKQLNGSIMKDRSNDPSHQWRTFFPRKEGRKYSTHFIYGYIASGIMANDHSGSERGNPLRHIGYSFRLAERVLLYTSSRRQDNTYHSPCYYYYRGALAGTRNRPMGPPHEISI